MKNVELELRLPQKTLSIEGKTPLKLDESLLPYAKTYITSAGEKALELKYRRGEPEDVEAEAGEIDDYFIEHEVRDNFEVSPCEDSDPAVIEIVGKFNVSIYH